MIQGARLAATAGQFLRFGVVGILSNAALFFLYLLLTHFGMGHKVTATLTYALGVLVTFAMNRSWSFQSEGRPAGELGRYIAAHGLGYSLNLIGLVLLVDLAGFSHQWVQGIMIVVVAVVLFLLQKFVVFRIAGQA